MRKFNHYKLRHSSKVRPAIYLDVVRSYYIFRQSAQTRSCLKAAESEFPAVVVNAISVMQHILAIIDTLKSVLAKKKTTTYRTELAVLSTRPCGRKHCILFKMAQGYSRALKNSHFISVQ